MSLTIKSNVGATLNTMKLKYTTTKLDKNDKEFAYYAIQEDVFISVVGKRPADMICPWLKGKDNHVLKVKST
jgi:hypothetical protein